MGVLSFGFCAVLCAFVGAYGYICYGPSVADVFYLSLPKDSVDMTIAEIVLSLVLLISFVLQMFPVTSFVSAVALPNKMLNAGVWKAKDVAEDVDVEMAREFDVDTEDELTHVFEKAKDVGNVSASRFLSTSLVSVAFQ